jgi:hypothetical protein
MQLNTPWFKELLAEHRHPCISIYQPLSRPPISGHPDAVEFGDLLRKAEALLAGQEGQGAQDAKAALERLETFRKDNAFWRQHANSEGLALFASPDYSRVVELGRRVEPSVTVADSFHVKPLIRTLQQVQRYHVLCVELRHVRLFEGDPYRLTELPADDVPKSLDDVLATASTGPDFVDDHDRRDAQAEQNWAPPGRVSVARFFRQVDEAVRDHYSRREQIPVIVVADVQYLRDFLAISKNEFVLKEGIPLNPHGVTPDRLRAEASRIVGRQFEQQLQVIKDAYQAAKARHLGSDEIPQVAEAAAVGRVGTLLVDSDAKIPGILHRDSGFLEQALPSDPRADDILDDLAEMVLKTDGQVFVLPHAQMPTDHGAAAVYRY